MTKENASLETSVYCDRVKEINSRIETACAESGRSREDVTLIVVSKFHSSDVVRKIHSCGISDFGENRHQEAAPKAAEVEDLDLTWHFVGQLQSKKVRAATQYASVFHSIDRDSVVNAFAKLDVSVSGFIQINMTDDPGRGGVNPEELLSFAETVLETPSINLQGIMAVAPLDEEPAKAFERLAGYSENLQTLAPEADKISAGMTGDFEEAIKFGATHLRIGSAITGNREYTH